MNCEAAGIGMSKRSTAGGACAAAMVAAAAIGVMLGARGAAALATASVAGRGLAPSNGQDVNFLSAQCRAGKSSACDKLAKMALTDKQANVRRVAAQHVTDQSVLKEVVEKDSDAEVRAAAVQNLTDQSVLVRVAESDSDTRVRGDAVRHLTDESALEKIAVEDKEASVRWLAVQKVTNQALLAKIAASDNDAGVRMAALPPNALVAELLNAAKQKAQYYPTSQPVPAAEGMVTATVKGWQQGCDEPKPNFGQEEPKPGLYMFGEDMSVFMLMQNADGFLASWGLPGTDGKLSSRGVVVQITTQNTDGGQSTYTSLSGVAWTPRTGAIGKLDLSGDKSLFSNANFDLETFKSSPGVIPFANGYAVNLYGQRIDKEGLVDPNPPAKGHYVSDDGKPLYGRLVNGCSGRLTDEVIFTPNGPLFQYHQ
jgi:hypothetical protein